MIIKSVSGKVLATTSHKGIRQTLEWCAGEGLDLSGADLRRAKLSYASLDGLHAPGACLWGADLTGSDIGFSNLQQADLRCCILKETCLAESDLSGTDLQGAYFASAILEGARLDRTVVSCPSFWDCDLQSADSIEGMAYNHRGEKRLAISSFPLVLKGFSKRLVLLKGQGLWGDDLYESGAWPQDAEHALFAAKTILEKTLRSGPLQSAKNPIRKIQTAKPSF